jgi:hypothetical protein
MWLISPFSADQSLNLDVPTVSSRDSRNLPEEHEAAISNRPVSPELIVESWQRIAPEHDIPPRSIAQVSGLLGDVLEYAEVAPTSDALQRYEQSLGAFLENYAFALRAEKASAGTAYWLAFCTVEGFLRDRPDSAERRRVQEQYMRVVEHVIEVIHLQIRSDLPAEEYREMRNFIAEGLARLRDQTRLRIRLYNEDFLCPAFKKEPDEHACSALVVSYSNSNDLPRFDDPHVSMRTTKSEAWQNRYKCHIENTIGMLLCDMFFDLSDLKLNKNRYWGYMDYDGGSMNEQVLARPSCWPAFIRFVQDPDYNQVHGWKREK